MTTFSNMASKIKDFLDSVEVELKKKASTVTLAEDANKLENKTVSELTTASRALATSHANQKNNPHTVTPEQVGSYSIDDFERTISNYITSGIIPISRYGDLSFTPPGISGNFEGATTVKTTDSSSDDNIREYYSMFLEDDGTLMFLRNGTDGSTRGAYYGYVQGAFSNLATGKLVVTARRYSPPFLGVGEYVKYLHQGGDGIISGLIENEVTKETKCFLALLNGTMDEISHTAVFLPPEWDAYLNKSECVIGKDHAYIVHNPGAASNYPTTWSVEFEIYTVPLSSFGTTSPVIPDKLNIVESIGCRGTRYTTGNIKISDKGGTENESEIALIYHYRTGGGLFSGGNHIGGSGRITTTSAFNETKDKLRVLVHQTPRYNPPGGWLQATSLMYSFVLDLTTMKAELDDGLTPIEVREDGTTTKVAFTGSMVGLPAMNYLTDGSGHDLSTRIYLAGNGMVFSSSIAYTTQNSDILTNSRWGADVSKFDLIKAPLNDRPPLSRSRKVINPTYGSAVGDSLDGFRLLPGNNAVILTKNSTSVTARVKIKLIPDGEKFEPNYNYKSVTDADTILGFAPTPERVTLGNDKPIRRYTNTITEIDGDDYQVNTSVLCNEGDYLSTHVSIDADLVPSTLRVSATMGQLDTLATQILGLANLSTMVLKEKATIELVIPQDPDAPAYAHVMIISTSNERRVVCALVDLDKRNGVITTLTPTSQVYVGNYGTVANAGTPDYSSSGRQGNHTLVKVSDGYMVVGNTNIVFGGNGSNGVKYKFFFDSATRTASLAGNYNSSTSIPGSRLIGIPGHGVGDILEYDLSTKLVYRPYARNRAEFQRWQILGDDSPKLVLVSQEVAQGWLVYFAEEMPVIINGSVGSVSPTQVNLVDIKADPTNTVFYVYVVDDNGSFSYLVLSNYVAEEINTLLIGTINTDNSRIVSVNVDKVTKFAGKTLSVVPKGQSIPVTAGLPSQGATLTNGWF